MQRFINKKTILILLSLTAVFLVVPESVYAIDLFDISFGTLSKFIIWPLELIVLPLAASILALAGNIMDQTINFGLHTAYIFSLSPAINLGWVIVRDIANIFFIFILIYISLGTIVQGTKFGTKQLLTQVIIAALLINFSLFITKAIVDVSNVFGNWLYGGVKKTLEINSTNPNEPTSLSGLIVTRMGIVNIWSKSVKPNTNNTGALLSYGPSSSITGVFLRLAVVLMVIYVFIYCAALFISRSITILFLMVFSPIGFMGGVLPQLKKYSGQWRDELTSAAIFPIAFLLMLYISLQFINSLKFLTGSALEDKSLNLFGVTVSVSEYFQYFLIIFLLLATLRTARDNSGEMGKTLGGMADSLGKLAVNAAIGYGTGGIAIAGRSLASGFFAKGKDGAPVTLKERGSKFAETLKSNSPLWTNLTTGPKFKEKMRDIAKKGTYDVRNAKVGGVFGPTLGELTKSTTGYDVSKTTLPGINVEQKTGKEIKEAKKKWDEEIGIDKAQKEILEDMRDLMELQNKLEEVERVDPKNLAGITTAQDAVNKKKSDMAKPTGPGKLSVDGRIRENLGKLNNKQLEKLDLKINANEHVAGLMTSSEIKHLKENSELSDSDKGKIWMARIKPLTDSLSVPVGTADRVTNVGKALKRLSDAEVGDLSIDKLTDPDVMENLTIGQLGKIAGNFARGDRETIRDYILNKRTLNNSINKLDSIKDWLNDKPQGQSF